MLLLTVLIAALGFASALKIKLLEPNERSMWTTGADVEVFWKVDGGSDDKNIKTVDLDLMQGRSKRPQLVDNIAFGVDWHHGDAFWTVDKSLPDGDDYFVRITSPEDKDFIFESAFFTVKQGSRKGKGKQSNSAAHFPVSVSFVATMLVTLAFIL
jgi:hypothetical protein